VLVVLGYGVVVFGHLVMLDDLLVVGVGVFLGHRGLGVQDGGEEGTLGDVIVFLDTDFIDGRADKSRTRVSFPKPC
jgi:hypothetical protein